LSFEGLSGPMKNLRNKKENPGPTTPPLPTQDSISFPPSLFSFWKLNVSGWVGDRIPNGKGRPGPVLASFSILVGTRPFPLSI
jgi:hypothetical protein